LSVISEHIDGRLESEENYNCDLDEPEPLVDFNQKEDPVNNYHERAVDVPRSSVSDGHSQNRDHQAEKDVLMRCVPSRNGDLQSRCKSQMLLDERNYVNWSEIQKADSMKKLSSSNHDVNELLLHPSKEVPEEAVESRHHQGIDKENSQKWRREVLPIAFAPHQQSRIMLKKIARVR
uniref:SCHIP-1 domain-containing protein n=1 Tax=Gongylonema pulchrum TaxID=637853 RepID=A0A183D049_9BILA